MVWRRPELDRDCNRLERIELHLSVGDLTLRLLESFGRADILEYKGIGCGRIEELNVVLTAQL